MCRFYMRTSLYVHGALRSSIMVTIRSSVTCSQWKTFASPHSVPAERAIALLNTRTFIRTNIVLYILEITFVPNYSLRHFFLCKHRFARIFTAEIALFRFREISPRLNLIIKRFTIFVIHPGVDLRVYPGTQLEITQRGPTKLPSLALLRNRPIPTFPLGSPPHFPINPQTPTYTIYSYICGVYKPVSTPYIFGVERIYVLLRVPI